MEIVIDTHILQSRLLVARFITLPLQNAHQAQHQAVEMLINHLYPDTHGKYEHLPSGAPYLPAHPEVYISITHTRGFAAIAVNADTHIGVDIEQVSQRVVRILPRVAHPTEIAALNLSENQAEAYTTAWTAKEAIFKAIPDGGIDFANHILIKFPTPLEYQPADSPTPISYTAKENRTPRTLTYNVVSIPLINDTHQITHILTLTTPIAE
ncbi:MAG: 4'-phosphopantetheinyl transferase superfamily protein [Muribaculaceae bacterium]|nr:4'-phosphopantetheinyl transferase superfamily protein [Muribaculaceae bacterium]